VDAEAWELAREESIGFSFSISMGEGVARRRKKFLSFSSSPFDLLPSLK